MVFLEPKALTYSEMSPCRNAVRAASVRLAAPSLPQIVATWNLTV